LRGICLGHTSKNIDLRIRQFDCAGDRERSLALARGMISGKIRNCRILLRRNDEQIPDAVLERLAEYAGQAEAAESFGGPAWRGGRGCGAVLLQAGVPAQER